jgi:hypothetical protein
MSNKQTKLVSILIIVALCILTPAVSACNTPVQHGNSHMWTFVHHDNNHGGFGHHGHYDPPLPPNCVRVSPDLDMCIQG